METLIHADIFFFISSIAVCFFIVAMIIVSVFVIKILIDLRKVSRKFQEESEKIAGDLDRFRTKVYDMEWDFKTLLAIARMFFRPKTKKARATTRKKKVARDDADVAEEMNGDDDADVANEDE